MKPWPRWFEKFGGELVPVIPHNAESDTIAKHLRGKCIGTRKLDGKWMGTTGSMADRLMTEADARQAHRDNAGIGILGRNFPALDIDVDDEFLAAKIEALAFKTLGPAPVRRREGSSRRLLMYAGAGLRKVRVSFRHRDDGEGIKPHAVELLATGQYYNVEGMHPSGAPYYWKGEHPCVLGPYGLTEISVEAVRACF